MRSQLRELLIYFKPDIVEALSEGNVNELLNELSMYFQDEDRQKIQCDSVQKGHTWAADGLIDTLKYSDDGAFVTFLQYLKKNRSTEELYKEIAEEYEKRGLASFLAPKTTVKTQGNRKRRAKSMMKEITPIVISNLSNGDFTHMLYLFEVDLCEADMQKIKCDLENHGKDKAISRMIDCLLHSGKNAFIKFITYISENKKSLFKDLKMKLEEYGLQEFLPAGGRGRPPVAAESIESKSEPHSHHVEKFPVSESAGSRSTHSNYTNAHNNRKIPVPESSGPGNTHSNYMTASNTSKIPIPESAEPGIVNRFPLEQLNRKTGSDSKENADEEMSIADIRGEKEISAYKMSSEPRGICLIINNEDFSETKKQGKKGYGNREGSSVDEENLVKLFSWLKFKVEKHRNKTSMEMWNIFLKLSEMGHSNFDSLVVCILSHGLRKSKEDHIMGVDGKPFTVASILSLFDGVHCRSLIGKPKLFFLQCCRGTSEDVGVIARGVIQHDGPHIQSENSITLAAASDFFVGYSTPPGYKSWRNTVEGSWYIATLCKVFKEFAWKYDLMSMAAKINALVAEDFTDEKHYQVPNPTMTLRKLVFFNPEK